jgi:pyruvate formate lyase activating enzyme
MDPNGSVADIQRYCLHDGPGIRTVIFLKGCPLECQWCANPETQSTDPELTISSKTCFGCGACVEICPQNAITIKTQSSKSLIPHINWSLCDNCLACTDTCVTGSLDRVGRIYSASEIIAIVMHDLAFYERSSGGVTLSGGEPTLQPQFSEAILRGCKSRGIHTAIETCGACPWAELEAILPYCDLVYFDVKDLDPQRHQEFTGRSNELILSNLEQILRFKEKVIVRIPIIPGINDSEEHIAQVADYIQSLDSRLECELIPYHRLGIAKYKNLGRTYQMGKLQPVSRAYLEKQKMLLSSFGISVVNSIFPSDGLSATRS